MTSRTTRKLFLGFGALLFAYAAFYPFLTVDTVLNLLARAPIMESRNLYLLLFLELSRLLTTLAALAVVIALFARGSDRADGRALALFLLFAVIGYEKVLGSHGYPGPMQEHMARALLAAGVSPELLRWVFGAVVWPVWPAAAALLRFSVVFPRPLAAATLEASGQQDRRGFMRSSALAGADVGAFFRAASRALLRRHGYAPLPLGIAACVLVVLHTALRHSSVGAAGYVVAFGVIALVATNLRASYLTARGADRARATWIVEGFVVALFMFLVSAAVLLLVPAAMARMSAFVLVLLVPAAVIVCLAAAVLTRAADQAGAPVDGTVREGTAVLAIVVTFGVLYRLFGVMAGWLGMPRALAALIAAIVAAMVFVPVRRAAERARLRVLERHDAAA